MNKLHGHGDPGLEGGVLTAHNCVYVHYVQLIYEHKQK